MRLFSTSIIYLQKSRMPYVSERREKNSTRGRKRPHRFFIKRKPHQLTRVEKTPEPWPMPERVKPRGEHSEGFFFTPTAGNSLLMRIELRTCWGATLPDRASQLAARPFAVRKSSVSLDFLFH